MKFLRKLFDFFKKTKTTLTTVKANVAKYIAEHKGQIRLMFTILDKMFPIQTGIEKMTCVVVTVCSAIGLDFASEEIAEIVRQECQKEFDKFKASLN